MWYAGLAGINHEPLGSNAALNSKYIVQVNMFITMPHRLVAFFFPLLLAACAHGPLAKGTAQPDGMAASPLVKVVTVGGEGATASETQTVDDAADGAASTNEAEKNLPKQELTGEMLYGFLLGDVASQRGNKVLAAQAYLELANLTQDPRVARRAAQLAFESRQMSLTVEAFELWVKLEPGSLQARQALLNVFVTGDKLELARPYIVDMLISHPEQAGRTLRQVYPLLAQHPDRETVYKLMVDLAQPYLDTVEVHMVLAQAAAGAGKQKIALEEARKARQMKPDMEAPVQLEAQLLFKDKPEQSLKVLQSFLATHPKASDTRLTYARMLLMQKKYPESRAEFSRLLDVYPDNAETAFTVAMLSLEMGDLDLAESAFRKSLANGKKDVGTVYYHLGQLNETRKHDDEALKNYLLVKEGESVYPAHLRVVYLLYKAGKLEEARNFLRETPTQNDRQKVQMILAEAQLLREDKQIEAAYDVLGQGMKLFPREPDLMYEAAMLAERMRKFDVFEELLRKVIELKSDYAQAYNALGYSMLDRDVQVEEGMRLVLKANELAPDDAGIIDSIGWGYYRLGDLDKSLEFLRRAYQSSSDPDPEIVAHFGELLWVTGDKAQAQKVWSDAAKMHPDSEPLQAVMKKYLP